MEAELRIFSIVPIGVPRFYVGGVERNINETVNCRGKPYAIKEALGNGNFLASLLLGHVWLGAVGELACKLGTPTCYRSQVMSYR